MLTTGERAAVRLLATTDLSHSRYLMVRAAIIRRDGVPWDYLLVMADRYKRLLAARKETTVPQDPQPPFGRAVHRLRRSAGKSRDSVGQAVGLLVETVCQIEVGTLPPPLPESTLFADWADVFGLTRDELIARIERESVYVDEEQSEQLAEGWLAAGRGRA